ncbi:PKD-like domain-containing protein [Pinibacter soli]|uniref:PKD-like domain-containing protein n=1 Tax=Pinibacter soli TaxID=3044211 RepID=A0ABT6RET2_9BACT|nr:PKD-like domain-containing protein [Pinibacter soli]MDI3321083.1 PKD-like domain-containing protein [Pinibacter soli]
MNQKLNWLLALTIIILSVYSCKKDDASPVPVISLSVTTDTLSVAFGDSVIIKATVNNNIQVEHSWKLNDSLFSKTAEFKYKPTVAGDYKLMYAGGNAEGHFTKNILLRVAAPIRPITTASNKYISVVFDYLPAPGQFVNEEGLGDKNAPKGIVGGTDALLHLGAYGGYVVFGFDHSILNKPGFDLAIYGNPLPPPMEWSEPGIVMVSQDKNGNGLPDDEWYELAGSEYNAGTTKKKYTITYYNPKSTADVQWKDNLGNMGAVEINPFHDHCYYPSFAANQDSISFTGALLKNTFGLMDNGFIYINTGFSFGYADNYSSGDDYAKNHFNSFNIDWAVDANGQSIKIPSIDFVKVYTGQNDKGNMLLGEISTEISGARDLGL